MTRLGKLLADMGEGDPPTTLASCLGCALLVLAVDHPTRLWDPSADVVLVLRFGVRDEAEEIRWQRFQNDRPVGRLSGLRPGFRSTSHQCSGRRGLHA